MKNARPVVVGVAGGSGSGKTTVASRILNRLGTDHAILIQHDSYYLDRSDLSIEDRANLNFDHPDALDTPLMVKHLQKLIAGRSVEVPVYDFARHQRTDDTVTVEPHSVILLDGILILADHAIRELLDVRVFVDTEPDLRLIRRIERDIATRQRSLDSVVRQYLETVRPMHLQFVEPSKQYADVLIPEGGFNDVAVDTLLRRIQSVLRDRGTQSKRPPRGFSADNTRPLS